MFRVDPVKLEPVKRDYAEFLRWYFDPSYQPRIGSFTQKLFEAFGCADVHNKRKLASIYPEYAYVVAEHMGELQNFNFILTPTSK